MLERTSADITIYGIDGQSIVTVPITAASRRALKLMESDYIQLSFTLSEAIYIPVGSYCNDEIFGKFCVTEEQMPKYNASNGGYDYELRMDAWYWMWNLKQCMLTRNQYKDGNLTRSESVWYLTWSLKEQMRQYMRNLQLLGFVADTYDFVTDDTVLDSFVDIDTDNVPKATEALTVSYNGTHLVDVLKNLADTWECEYWVTGTEDAFVIHFGKCENGTLEGISLQTNAQNITPQDDTSERGDKLFYFGGTDNIPNTYRKSIELVASDVTDSDNDGYINTFKAKDRSGKYAKLNFGHFGGEKWAGMSGYILIEPNLASTSGDNALAAVTNLTTVGGDTLVQMLRELVFAETTHTAESLPFSSMLASVPTKVVVTHLYIDYIDLSGDPTEIITYEVTDSIINDCSIDSDVAIQRIYMVATDADTGEQEPLEVSQWRNIAMQTYDSENNVYILSIGITLAEDAGGVYVTALLGGIYQCKLYINQTASLLEWSTLTGLANYQYVWESGNEKYLYDKTLVMIRHAGSSSDAEPVRSESEYLLEYDFYYLASNHVFSNIYLSQHSYSLFTQYLNGYAMITSYSPHEGGSYASYLIGMADNYIVQSSSKRLSLVIPQQTPRISLSVMSQYMDDVPETLTFSPEVYLIMVNASIYPTKAAAWNYILNNGIDEVGVTEPKLIYTNLPSITLYKKDFELRNGDYCSEYALPLPSISIDTDWTELYVSEGYFPVLIVKMPIHYQWLSGFEMKNAFSASFREEGKQDTFIARLKEVTVDNVTDYVFEFCQWNPWMPTLAQFPEGTVFRMAEYTPEPAYSATLWNVPYAYWVDDLDDPASLLSIGDKRLQLPVYNATEFEQYKTTGMSYENGYIVKNGMAYKNGYIIPYTLVGNDDYPSLRELTVTDDTIYPDGKLLVKTVKRVNAKEEIEVEGQSQRQEWSYKQYHLQLRLPDSQSVLDFDRDYILPNGEPLQIRFLVPEDVKEYYESGAISQAEWEAIQAQCKLAGMQFNVAYNNEINYQADDESVITQHTEDVWIERNDDFGAKLPSETLYPQVLDPCVLVNWNVLALSSLGLIARAEYKLLDKAFEYYAALRDGNFTFTAEMMSDWLFDLVGGLQFVDSDGKNVIDSEGKNFLVKNEYEVYAIPQLGQRVRVTHAALKTGYKDTRIIGMELSLDKPYDTPKLTIGETEAYSRLKQIEKEITKLN